MKNLMISIAALALFAPLAASAAEGWVVADISLQAGPDTEYPSIEELRAGTPVSIQGCIDGWTWCDVVVDGSDRGWVPGTFLEEEYQNQRVLVIDYGPRISIPIVSFSLGTYWERHYHDRPFYAQRQEWSSRAIHPHAPPRPSGVASSRNGSPGQAAKPNAGTQNAQTAQRPPVSTATTTPTSSPTNPQTHPQPRPASPAQDRQPQDQRERVTKAEPQPTPTRPDARKPVPEAAPEQAPAAPPSPVPEAKERRTAQNQAHEEPKAREGEPKAKDELQKPNKSKDKEKKDDSGGG